MEGAGALVKFGNTLGEVGAIEGFLSPWFLSKKKKAGKICCQSDPRGKQAGEGKPKPKVGERVTNASLECKRVKKRKSAFSGVHGGERSYSDLETCFPSRDARGIHLSMPETCVNGRCWGIRRKGLKKSLNPEGEWGSIHIQSNPKRVSRSQFIPG